MPNPFQRLRSIFDPSIMGEGPSPNIGMGPSVDFSQPPITTPPFVPPTPQVEPDFDPSAMMGQLYKPETAANDRFNQLVNAYPQYEKPGFWRSMAGALSAFGPGGHDIGMKVANFRNDQRMMDWKNQIGPAQAAANLERYENQNNRSLAHQTVQNEINYRRNEATRKRDEEKTAIARDRAAVYRLKNTNPNYKFDYSGPTVLVSDPTTGKTFNSGIPTGNIDDMTKLDVEQGYAMSRIAATGDQARQTEVKRQEGRTDLAETRGWKVYNVPDPDNPGQFKGVKINEITGEVADLKPPSTGPVGSVTSSGANRPELPTQTKVRMYNNASRLADERPDLAPFIKFGPGANEFSILPLSDQNWYSKKGPNQAQLDEINSLIYGGQAPMGQSGVVSTLPQGGPNNPQMPAPVIGGGRGGGPSRQSPQQRMNQTPQAPPGWTYVRKPDGSGWTAVRSATGAK